MTRSERKKGRRAYRLLLAAVGVMVCSLLSRWLMADCIAEDVPGYEAYVASMSRSVPEGTYTLMPCGSDALCFGCGGSEAGSGICLVPIDAGTEQRVRAIFSEGTYHLAFYGTDFVMEVRDGNYGADAYLQTASRADASRQLWKITAGDEEGSYYITSEDGAWALTCDIEDRRVYLSAFEASEEQKWVFK